MRHVSITIRDSDRGWNHYVTAETHPGFCFADGTHFRSFEVEKTIAGNRRDVRKAMIDKLINSADCRVIVDSI